MFNLHEQTEEQKLKCCLQSHSVLALDRKMKQFFNFAMSPLGYLDFWGWKSWLFFLVSHIRSRCTWQNWTRSRLQKQNKFVFSLGSERRVSSDLHSWCSPQCYCLPQLVSLPSLISSSLWLQNNKVRRFAFELKMQDKSTYLLAADSEAEMEDWINTLNKILHSSFEIAMQEKRNGDVHDGVCLHSPCRNTSSRTGL